MRTINKKRILSTWLIFLSLPMLAVSQGIINSSGTHVVPYGSVYIVINNAGFRNDGTFTDAGGTVTFTGATATTNSFIQGTGTTVFNNLTLNKTSNGILLNGNIAVNGTLNLLSGDSIFLNNYSIDLGNTGSISGEVESRRITGLTGGYIQATRTMNAPSGYNPGNLGIEITSAANLGSTIIRRGHQQQSGASINRYFDIIPTNNSSLNATLKFYYFDAELAGISAANLAVFSSDNQGINWVNHGEDGLNNILKYVNKAGLNQLDRFTLSNISQPLSIQLLYLQAQPAGNKVNINWATGNENNNDHFEIERSVDGHNFYKIATVGSKGNSSITQQYSFTDLSPLNPVSYYRIKQVDIDNKFSYSYIVKVNLKSNNYKNLVLYPNPAQNVIKLIFNSTTEEKLKLELTDIHGSIIQQKFIDGEKGINFSNFNIVGLPNGIYNITISASGLLTINTFIKN
jgi:hypothetical protein